MYVFRVCMCVCVCVCVHHAQSQKVQADRSGTGHPDPLLRVGGRHGLVYAPQILDTQRINPNNMFACRVCGQLQSRI